VFRRPFCRLTHKEIAKANGSSAIQQIFTGEFLMELRIAGVVSFSQTRAWPGASNYS
jgi:hypothetical protein